MKTILGLVVFTVAASAFAGDLYVQGYTRQDGTYVQPHHRSSPDNTIQNNYSTQGNTNPYTGQQGTVNPYPPQQPMYVQPAPMYAPPPVYQQPANSYYQQPQQYQQKQCPVGSYSC